MTTRAKEKERALTAAELEEHLNKLREEEPRCNAMHQHIQARMAMLQQDQAEPSGLGHDPSSSTTTCTPTKKKASTVRNSNTADKIMEA